MVGGAACCGSQLWKPKYNVTPTDDPVTVPPHEENPVAYALNESPSVSPEIVNEVAPVALLTVPSTGSVTITFQNVRAGSPLSVNVATKEDPVGVNVMRMLADPPETNPLEGLAVNPYGACTA